MNTGHIYEFNGIHYPSVTTILSRTETKEQKQFWSDWRRKFSMSGFKNAEDYRNYTAIRGTLVHYNVLNSLHFSTLDPSGLPKISEWLSRHEILIPEIEHCRRLWNESGISQVLKGPFIIETPSYHPALMYAGTPDLIGTNTITGKRILVDLKTSSGERDEHRIQLGGYAAMVSYWKPEDPIEEAILIYLNPKMKKALRIKLNREELKLETQIFNEKVKEFWSIPGIKVEYNL